MLSRPLTRCPAGTAGSQSRQWAETRRGSSSLQASEPSPQALAPPSAPVLKLQVPRMALAWMRWVRLLAPRWAAGSAL